MDRHAYGFSLMELLVGLAVAALLLGIALPAFSGVLEAGRAQDARAALLASYVSAVNRATITGSRTVLCPSADGQNCLDGADWSQGWIVFLDTNGDRERALDERITYRQEALMGRVRLRSTEGRKRIVFQASGSNAGSNVTFTLCDGRGPAKAKALILSNEGRLRDGPASPEAVAATCL